jgi:hypothetical protein
VNRRRSGVLARAGGTAGGVAWQAREAFRRGQAAAGPEVSFT